MSIDTNLFSMQIAVPHSVYGACEYFMPVVLRTWIIEHSLNYWYISGESWGNGYTDGITNQESVYVVNNIHESDALVFKIQFPKCKINVCKQ